MQITVNGSQRDMPDGITVADLLTLLELNPRTMVVQRNDVLIDRNAFDTASLAEGDVVELVRFVGGG